MIFTLVFAGSCAKSITSTYTYFGVYGAVRNRHVIFLPVTAEINPVPLWNQQGTTVPIPLVKPRLALKTSLLLLSLVGNPMYILPAVVASLYAGTTTEPVLKLISKIFSLLVSR